MTGRPRELAEVYLDDVVGHDERALYGVLELAHVARPAVVADGGERSTRKALGRPARR